MTPDDPLPSVLQLVFYAPGTSELAQIFTIIALLIFSALIAASEIAYFSLSPVDLKTLYEKPSTIHQLILRVTQHPQRFLATVLICNNAINIAVIILSTSVLNEIMIFNEGQESVKFLVEVVAVTFLLLIFCEVLPKVYARQNSLKVARIMARPIQVLEKVFHPFTWIMLVTGSRFYNRRLAANQQITVDELEHALEITFGNEPANQEKKILEGIVKFGSTTVRQIMCPRTGMVAVDKDTDFNQLLEAIREHGYSRMPVFDGNQDKIQGILFVKDLLPFLDKTEKPDWNSLIREPFFVPENRKIDDLLVDFKSTRNHMAIVVDEYGGTVGLVTLEDVLEEIVGDITDEFDDDQIAYTRIDENNYVFEGKTALIDFYKVLKINGDELEKHKGESDTLAGLILEIAGRMPRTGEVLQQSKYRFTIEAADNKRIKQVKVTVGNTMDALESSLKKGFPMLLMAGLLLASCGGEEQNIPLPEGFMRIELPAHTYKPYNGDCPYTFEMPEYSDVVAVDQKSEGFCYHNIYFPTFKATFYFSYTAPGDSLGKLLEQCHKLAYSHDVKASGIEPEQILNDSSKVYGLIYHITGNAASSTQFYVTDSTQNFLRGSLYFYAKPNYDSIKPVLNHINDDLRHMLHTLKWKSL